MTGNPTDRRAHDRLTFLEPVTAYIAGYDHPMKFFAGNISRGGVFLRTKVPLPRGRVVGLQIETDSGLVQVDEGQVAWCKPFEPEIFTHDGSEPGMGVVFIRMSPQSREHIDELLGELTRRQALTAQRLVEAGTTDVAPEAEDVGWDQDTVGQTLDSVLEEFLEGMDPSDPGGSPARRG